MLEDVSFRQPPPGPLPEVYNATPGDDGMLSVEFYRHPSEDRDCVRIGFRGDPTTVIETPVEEEHRHRFSEQWQAYASGAEQAQSGTPLYETKWIDPGMIARLNALKVYTVEQLAMLNDGALEQSNLMGLGMFRERARKHMERASRALGMDQAYAANQQLADQVRQLQEQLQQVMAQQQATQDAPAAPESDPKPQGNGNGRQGRRR